MRRKRIPTSPGVILRELYLAPRGISVTDFAKAVGCSRKHMSQIIHGKARIEASLAMRIGAVLGTSAELWLNLQNKLDLYQAERELKKWKPQEVFHAR
ncbi:MAG: HigA family addiction module antitoxin [Candidatus Bipolaricaulota bacterium]|nr:HigA family addiction module antitoxin [Candidatus Bipolaricaulota bacterium]MDW8141386.1 HigA family addiction module antitoxin [Candidatus Bipolaricaulota bacterium]